MIVCTLANIKDINSAEIMLSTAQKHNHPAGILVGSIEFVVLPKETLPEVKVRYEREVIHKLNRSFVQSQTA